jgi:hypothetical protein
MRLRHDHQWKEMIEKNGPAFAPDQWAVTASSRYACQEPDSQRRPEALKYASPEWFSGCSGDTVKAGKAPALCRPSFDP